MRSKVLDQAFNQIDPSLFRFLENRTVLVTGATGLIGSLACKALVWACEKYTLNISVVALVRNSDKFNEIMDGYASNNLTSVAFDLTSGKEFPLSHVDFILHAASITASKLMVEYPVDVINTSLRGTQTMLDLAQRVGATMTYVSSMEYYGSLPANELATEDKLGYLDLTSARSCYPEAKRMCECLCNAYAKQFGVNVCSARLAQTFGAGVMPNDNRAFMQFARSAVQGKDIILKTKGLSEANYVNSIDAIAALLLLFQKGSSGESYNIVNESSHSIIKNVAKLAINILGSNNSTVVFDIDERNASGYAPDVHLRLSSEKMNDLGWVAKTSLQDSFLQLVSYAKEQELF